METTWPLVGRDPELAAISAAMVDPDCGGVVLVGVAGVGKTRLARTTLEAAGERGMAVASVRANRSASTIPFAALAPLLPEVDLSIEAGASIFRAAAAVVDNLRGDGRLLLMVDDAQELDDASAALLDQLISGGTLFVVLTVRAGERMADALHGMWKDERIVRVDLAPLSEDDVRTLTETALGGPVDGATHRALMNVSSGNALFLRELIQGGVEAGTLTEQFGIWRLDGPLVGSPRVQDLISQRLSGLTDAERTALELVALGEPLELPLLTSLGGPVAPVSIETIERLEERVVVEVDESSVPPVARLAHPLHGEVLRSRLSSTRRARLCRMLAEAADALPQVRPHDMIRAAVWRLDGGGACRPEAMMQASRAAFRSGDYELAARLARSSWEGGGSVMAAHLLGEALDYAGRPLEAEEILAAAWEEATTDEERTAIALRRGANLFRALGRAADADAVVADALARVTDESCIRSLHALQANHLLLAGDAAGALRLTEPLLDTPEGGAFAQASLDTGVALALAGRSKEAIAHTDEALAVRLDLDDEGQMSALGIYFVARALAFSEAGRLEEALETAEVGYQVSVERSDAGGQAWFASILGWAHLIQGRLPEAEHRYREVAALFQTLGHPGQRWGLGGIALAAGQLGQATEAQMALDELAALPATTVHVMDVGIQRGRAWSALAAGDLALARSGLWEAVELAAGWGQLATQAAALHDLVRIGEGAVAARQLEALGERVDGDLMVARVTYAQAVLADDMDLAAQATDQFEAIGALLYAAEGATLEARLSAEAGLKRRTAAAEARVAKLQKQCNSEGARIPALAQPSREAGTTQLSLREREVALLAAQGLSSREIADRLFVSIRTVENHLQRSYTKLGITGRADLPAALNAR